MFVTILSLAVGLLSSNAFRQWAVHKVNDILYKEFGSEVSIGDIRFEPLSYVVLEKVKVMDKQHDTAFFIRQLRLDTDLLQVKDNFNEIWIKDLEIDGAVVKFIKHKDSAAWNYEFFFEYFESKDTTPKLTSTPFKLRIRDLQMKNSSFTMTQLEEEKSDASFDPLNFKFYDLNTRFKQFSVTDDSLFFDMISMRGKEKNGLEIDSFSAITHIHSKGLEFYNLYLATDRSVLRDTLTMTYGSWDDLGDFLEKVRFKAHLKSCSIYPGDINYFAGKVFDIEENLEADAQVSGTINNMKIRQMTLGIGKITSLGGYADIRYPADPENTFFDIKLDRCRTSADDIRIILRKKDLGYDFDKFGIVSFEGKLTGFIHSFTAYGSFNTALGKIVSDIQLNDIQHPDSTTYSGDIKMIDYDLGNSFDIDPWVKKLSLDARVEGKSFDPDKITVKLKGTARNVGIKDYVFSEVPLDGYYAQKKFMGRVGIDDANIKLKFDGDIDFSPEVPVFAFRASVKDADLYALKLDTVRSVISANVVANVDGFDVQKLQGSILMDSLFWQRGNKNFFLDSLVVRSIVSGRERKTTVSSQLFTAQVNGAYDLENVSLSLQHYLHRVMPTFVPPVTVPYSEQSFTYNIQVNEPNYALQLFYPDVEISSFELKGSYDAKRGIVVDGTIPRFKAGDFVFLETALSTPESSINNAPPISINCQKIMLKDSMLVQELQSTLRLDDKQVSFSLKNSDSKYRLGSEISGVAHFADSSFWFELEESSIFNKEKTFVLRKGAFLEYRTNGEFSIKEFEFASNGERLRINGNLTRDFYSNIRVDFDSLRIGFFSKLLGNADMVNGIAHGNVIVYNVFDVPVISSDFMVQYLALGSDTIGRLTLKSTFDDQTKIVNIDGAVRRRQQELMKITGEMNFNERTANNLDLKITSHNLKAAVISPFTKGIFSNFAGTLESDIRIKGKFLKPDIRGKVIGDSLGFMIDYLRTNYRASHLEIDISPTRISIPEVSVADEQGKFCRLSGEISHDYFSDMFMDIRVDRMDNYLVLNTNAKDNDLFYGRAYFTGKVSITGPMDNLFIEVTGRNGKNTTINLPVSDEESMGENEFIRFIKPDEETKPIEYKQQGLSLRFNLEVTPDFTFKMIFDSQLGDEMEGRGSGFITLDMNTYGDFKMYGTFTIKSGSYLFTALDVINKKFEVSPGSTITWNGDPLNAILNLTAIYRSRTSPVELVRGLVPTADLNKYNQRIPVEAILYLRGNLLRPDIRFGINVPDLSLLTASSVNTSPLLNVLRRIENNQEEMSKQVFSLMVFNSFVTPSDNNYIASQDDASGTSGQSVLSSNVGNLLSAQLTNWLSKIDPNWNLSVNYQSGGALARDELILSAGRQLRLFNNSVRFDVSYDANNNLYNLSSNILLSADGNYQFRVFTKNANNLIYNQNIQSFGGGLYFRWEFEDLSSFRKRIYKLIGRKEEEAAAQ